MSTNTNKLEITQLRDTKSLRSAKLVDANDILLLRELQLTGLNARIAVDAYKDALNSTIVNGKQFGLVFLANLISNKLKSKEKIYMTENGLI